MMSQFELSSRAALCRQLASQDPANQTVWMAEARSWSRLVRSCCNQERQCPGMTSRNAEEHVDSDSHCGNGSPQRSEGRVPRVPIFLEDPGLVELVLPAPESSQVP